MEWHYADGQEKRGPFSDSQIKELITSGAIQPATLVWNATFTQWKPARETALFPRQAADASSQLCIITGKTYPVSQMIKTQHGWVSAEGKDRYYQSLRENAPIPTAAGVTNARRDGRKLVIPINGSQLPSLCVKTGEPVQESEFKKKTLYWCSPWAALAILLNILIYLILYLILRKKVVVHIPLSQTGRGIVRKHLFISLGLALGGFAVIVFGGANFDEFAWVILLGILMLLGGLIYGAFKANALRATKVLNGEAWLAGACPKFLEQLPEY